MNMLKGIKVVNLAMNLPGPAAARVLKQFGAHIYKIEPINGDSMLKYHPEFYNILNKDVDVINLNLKYDVDKGKLLNIISKSDLFLTSFRPEALENLNLTWEILHKQFPKLCMVEIIGYLPPNENVPGYDITYQAKGHGLLTPPDMPKSMFADLSGAQMAANGALALLLNRERVNISGHMRVALSEAAQFMSEPIKIGFAGPDANLTSGKRPDYNMYETRNGWIAVAALEPVFKKTLDNELLYGKESRCPSDLASIFKEKTAKEWEIWAKKHDIPIVEIIQ